MSDEPKTPVEEQPKADKKPSATPYLDGLDEYRAELKAKREKKRSQQQDGVNITNATDEQTVACIHGKESLLISPIILLNTLTVRTTANSALQCSLRIRFSIELTYWLSSIIIWWIIKI